MDGRTIAGIVKMILRYFVETWHTKSESRKTIYNHIDVTLSKLERRRYSVQVTNYGSSASNVLEFAKDVFRDSISAGIFPGNACLATIYSKVNVRQTVCDLRLTKESLSLHECTDNQDLENFSYWKEYLSLKLKYALDSRDVDRFKEAVLNEIALQKRFTVNVKFTFRQNTRVLYNNRIGLDDEYATCRSLCVALTSVIRQSSSTEFKEACFGMLGVDNSHQTEAAIMANLLPMVHGNYVLGNETETRKADSSGRNLRRKR